MIETYSETIEDLFTGEGSEAESSVLVCDRCGFATPRDRLTLVDGLELCERCVDEEDG